MMEEKNTVAMRYVDESYTPTQNYPLNPSGSQGE